MTDTSTITIDLSPEAGELLKSTLERMAIAPRRFAINRTRDVSGVSGTGWVATGVQWRDGKCAMRWRGDKASTNVYDSIENLIGVHGHGDMTKVVWLDPEV